MTIRYVFQTVWKFNILYPEIYSHMRDLVGDQIQIALALYITLNNIKVLVHENSPMHMHIYEFIEYVTFYNMACSLNNLFVFFNFI